MKKKNARVFSTFPKTSSHLPHNALHFL